MAIRPRLPQLKNLPKLRTLTPWHAEIYDDVSNSMGNLASQLQSDPNGTNVTPPTIGAVTLQIGDPLVDVTITDNSKIARAVNYFLEYSTDSLFVNPRVVALGPSRDWHNYLPNGIWYFRGYSQYPAGGPPSPPVLSTPPSVTVAAGVTLSLLPAQGSGTGKPSTGGGHGAGKVISR